MRKFYPILKFLEGWEINSHKWLQETKKDFQYLLQPIKEYIMILKGVSKAGGPVDIVTEIALERTKLRDKIYTGKMTEKDLIRLVETTYEEIILQAYARVSEKQNNRKTIETSPVEQIKILMSVDSHVRSVKGKAYQVIGNAYLVGQLDTKDYEAISEAPEDYHIDCMPNMRFVDLKVGYRHIKDYYDHIELKSGLYHASLDKIVVDHLGRHCFIACMTDDVTDNLIDKASAYGFSVAVLGGYNHPDAISFTEMVKDIKRTSANELKRLKAQMCKGEA